jgi:hypothetical protein
MSGSAMTQPISPEAAEQLAQVLLEALPADGHTHWSERARRESGATFCLPWCLEIRAALQAAGRLPEEGMP